MLDQVDTFFNVSSGRLKLRELGPDHGELICYDRPDIAGPRSSNYSIFKTDQPAVLRELLAAALGVRGIVRKRRKLYFVGQTRVHIDEVVGLGAYLELEVVPSPGQSREEGEAIAGEIMRQLEIQVGDLVEGAYIDLLAATGGACGKLER